MGGARIFVKHSNVVAKIIDKAARVIIEEWAIWKTAVSGEQGESFVERLHLESLCLN